MSIIFFVFYGMTADINITSGKKVSETSHEQANLEGQLQGDSMAQVTNRQDYFTQHQLDSMPSIDAARHQLELYTEYFKTHREYSAKDALKELQHRQSFLNKWLYKKTVDYNQILENPHAFFNYALGKSPIVIFFFLPVFALFIWLIYLGNNFTYMEHLIFTFHVQTFFFFLFILSYSLDFIFASTLFNKITILIFLVYLYRALRNFYHQKKWETLFKFIVLNFIFLILAAVATIVAVFASFAIY